MNVRIAIFAAIAAIATSPAYADSTTLSEALAAAYQNNPQLAQARASLASSDEDVASARSGMLPEVSGSYSFNYSDTQIPEGISDGASLSISQVIWNNGRLKAGVDAAKLGVLGARQSLVLAEQDILLATISAYMNVRAQQATFSLAENNIAVLNEQLRAANERFEVGEITRTDVSLTQSRVAAARSNREASRAGLLSAIANYISIVGEEPKQLAGVPALPALPKTLDEVEAKALAQHPRVLSAHINLAIAKLNAKLAAKNRSPALSLGVTGNVGRSGTLDTGLGPAEESVSAGVTLSMPIYQGGQLDSDRRRTNALVRVQETALEQAIRSTRAAVQSAFANYRSASASKRAVQQQIRASQIAYEGVSEEAQLGARTTLDVLDAEQDLLSARSNLVAAIREEQVAAYSILAEMGELRAESLGLSVELFEPETNYNRVNKASPLGSKRLEMLDVMEKRR